MATFIVIGPSPGDRLEPAQRNHSAHFLVLNSIAGPGRRRTSGRSAPPGRAVWPVRVVPTAPAAPPSRVPDPRPGSTRPHAGAAVAAANRRTDAIRLS